MREYVAKENIRRFEAQLAQCDDAEKRRVLLYLLEREHKRLNEIQGRSPPDIKDSQDPLPELQVVMGASPNSRD